MIFPLKIYRFFQPAIFEHQGSIFFVLNVNWIASKWFVPGLQPVISDDTMFSGLIEWASALVPPTPLCGGGRAGSVNKTTGEVKTFKTYTKQTGGSSS